MRALERHPAFERLRLNNDTVLELPGLKIYPDSRKVFCGRREVNLTTKEYKLLCLLAILFTPLLVLPCEVFLRNLTNALTMPETCYKIHPLLTAIGAGRATKETVRIRESSILQRGFPLKYKI